MKRSFAIGWDVGAWSSKAGDALWILDASAQTYGKPQHGNWGAQIRQATSAADFIRRLFECCEEGLPPDIGLVTLAIDAPLAFPAGFVKLLAGDGPSAEPLGKAIDNPYLFRRTEAFAAEKRKRNPLSPLQDQIGSQATKIAHVLAKFGLKNNGKGVWCEERAGDFAIRVIEAYPAMCKQSRKGPLLPGRLKSAHDGVTAKHFPVTDDENDALICALVGHLHAVAPEELHSPDDSIFSPDEGWIWFPKR